MLKCPIYLKPLNITEKSNNLIHVSSILVAEQQIEELLIFKFILHRRVS